ncbi:alpha/beta hydrolase [Streptomyces massasporeus]|uniref:alpha/beta hydrolase n=1 Tax=Streptomyces massasporeus TaxID=67324 RepID=UPI0033FF0625
MTDRTAADLYGALTTRPPLDPELAPVEEARGAFPGPVGRDPARAPAADRRGFPHLGFGGSHGGRQNAGGRAPGTRAGGGAGHHCADSQSRRGPRPQGRHPQPPRWRDDHGGHRDHVGHLLPHLIEGRAVVVSVEYRLAPDHPDPAPVEDCYAGLVWMAKSAAELGIDPERLLIAGVSGGGGLAAGTALLARDRAFPRLSHQVLICPMLDDRSGPSRCRAWSEAPPSLHRRRAAPGTRPTSTPRASPAGAAARVRASSASVPAASTSRTMPSTNVGGRSSALT